MAKNLTQLISDPAFTHLRKSIDLLESQFKKAFVTKKTITIMLSLLDGAQANSAPQKAL